MVVGADAQAVTIAWSPVGNPGNEADTTVMNDGTSGYGAVPYSYRIDTYDVTNAQYVEFLNTKDQTGANTLRLWNSGMADPTFGGISLNRNNLPGSRYFLTVGHQDHPVNFISWYDSIRFANWLNNGQGSGDTETGAYTLGALGAGGVPLNGNSITRNAGATVFLPSEDEWYKAAYYNPATNSYFQYPTSNNTTPIASSPTGLPNHANFSPGGPNLLTDVGAYTGTTSPYGAFDMGGNVFQWNEAVVQSLRGYRGGGFDLGGSLYLSSSTRPNAGYPASEVKPGGFRVATITVPEPSSLGLAAFGLAGLAAWRWRRGKGFKNGGYVVASGNEGGHIDYLAPGSLPAFFGPAGIGGRSVNPLVDKVL